MIKTLTFFLSIIILFVIIDFSRRGKLTFKYAIGWLCLGVLGILFTVFDQLLFSLSDFCGFALMSNFIFFSLFCFFVFSSLLLSTFLCQQNKRNDIMAQKIALLEKEIKTLKGE